jgi:endonuclease III related protein
MGSKYPIGSLLMTYYHALRERFGHRQWWPAETPFEVCVGAVLTQNTAWKNVVKAITNLKEADVLQPEKIYELSLDKLADLIKPSGYYNVKAQRLMNFVRHLMENHGGDLFLLLNLPQDSLREQLLSIKGIGKETADSIILYAAQKPIFVIDAYTKRILLRHGLVPENADYDSTQNLFEENLVKNVGLFNDFHAQLVALGHHHCKKKPLCAGCPLEQFMEWGDNKSA